MEKIVEKLNSEKKSLEGRINNYNEIKLKRDILKGIVEKLKSGKSYCEIKDSLMFLEHNLMLVYSKDEVMDYCETVFMILVGLIKCENKKKVAEDFIEFFKNKLKDITTIFEDSISKLETELNDISIVKTKNMLSKVERLICISNANVECSSGALKNIYDLLKSIGIPNEDILIFLEKLKLKNKKRKDDNSNVLRLLTFEFAKISMPIITYDEKASVSRDWYKYSSFNNEEEFNSILLHLDEEENLNVRKMIIYRLLREIERQYEDNKTFLCDRDFYFSKSECSEIIYKCQEIVKFYNILLKKYYELSIPREEEKDNSSSRRFVFARCSNNTYFEKDLSDLSNEILASALELLNDIIGGNELLVMKKISSVNDMFEFKYDNVTNQLRVVGYLLKNNIFMITGIFQKKQYNGRKYYANQSERNIDFNADVDELLGCFEDDLVRIREYISENKRKGTRK